MKAAPFEVIAVLDLKDGQVVHAVAGKREEYMPVQSVLCDSAGMNQVVEAIVGKLGIHTFYIADLDSISGQKGNLEGISYLIQTFQKKRVQARFFLDAGVTDSKGVEKLLQAGIDQVIIGTETLLSLKVLQDILVQYGTDKIMLSLDIREHKVLSKAAELKESSPLAGLAKLLALGLTDIMIIELERVGTRMGLNQAMILGAVRLMEDIAERQCSLYVGGGVASIDEIRRLQAWGAGGVLLATMLHQGILKREDIQSLNASRR